MPRDLEPVAILINDFEARLGCLRHGLFEEQHTEAFFRASTDAASQLVQLGETETLGMLDDHHRCVGHVNADFDYGRRHENVHFAANKGFHRRAFFGRLHASVQQSHGEFWH